jgi:predicted ABC-type ATPase
MSLSDVALLASISQVILAAAIGTVTVFILRQQSRIAQQQWQTNHNQFRLHFFDRRIAVYDAVIELAARIAAKGTLTKEELRECVKMTREASFIFDDEI